MEKAASFVWRVNRDSVDSICLSCYGTVATAEKETDLLQAEEEHVCFAVESQRRYVESQMGTF
jgi:hypothetical protein